MAYIHYYSPSIPANIINSRIAMAIADAEKILMKDTWRRVRGIEHTIPISVAMTLKTTVHCEWSDKVFKTRAAVRTERCIISQRFVSW